MSGKRRRRPLSLGVVGDLDARSVTGHLAVRVIREELRRRGPELAVTAYGPQPYAGPLDGGEPVEGLGPSPAARRMELAGTLGAVAVLDEAAEPAGIAGSGESGRAATGPSGPAATGPSVLASSDLVSLVRQALDDQALDRRLAWLRLLGWHPAHGRTIALHAEGLDGLAPEQVEILHAALRASPDLRVVVIGAGGGPLAEAVGSRAAELTCPVSLEDVGAVAREAVAVIGAGAGLESLALAYGRPFLPAGGMSAAAVQAALMPGGPDPGLSPGPAGVLAERQARAKAALDRLVGLFPAPSRVSVADAVPPLPGLGLVAQSVLSRRAAAGRLDQLDRLGETAAYRSELEARVEKLRLESAGGYARYETEIEALREAGQTEAAALRAEIASLHDEARVREGHHAGERASMQVALDDARDWWDRLDRELRATHETLLFRWASRPRRVYGMMRRLAGKARRLSGGRP
ncbi:MAG: hypothetical protein ACRD0J_10415 [Acidimicrobiales bacterium]